MGGGATSSLLSCSAVFTALPDGPVCLSRLAALLDLHQHPGVTYHTFHIFPLRLGLVIKSDRFRTSESQRTRA